MKKWESLLSCSEEKQMKIGIITVYNSINSGSFWQAKSMQEFLINRNNEVYFVKRPVKGSSVCLLQKAKKVIKKLIKFQFKQALTLLKTFKEFKKAKLSFRIINSSNKIIKDLDLIIIGSDTVWNLDSDYFKKHYKFFFADNFKDKKIITYAGSVANTSVEEFLKREDIKDLVNKFNLISVRDEHTKEVLQELTDKEIYLVCDPTFLIDKAEYKKYIKKTIDEEYIFLYLFKDLSEEYKKQLIDYAYRNNLKIISGTNESNFCDETIVNTPYNFLSYMYYAKYVITDTFHGTAFSINLKKQFVVINRQKNKVNELLKRLKLNDRLVDDVKIDELFNQKIDYVKNDEIHKFKRNSMDYIDRILTETNSEIQVIK